MAGETAGSTGEAVETKQWMLNLVDEIAFQDLGGQRKMVRNAIKRHNAWKGRNPIDVECEVENRVRSNLLNIVKSHVPH